MGSDRKPSRRHLKGTEVRAVLEESTEIGSRGMVLGKAQTSIWKLKAAALSLLARNEKLESRSELLDKQVKELRAKQAAAEAALDEQVEISDQLLRIIRELPGGKELDVSEIVTSRMSTGKPINATHPGIPL